MKTYIEWEDGTSRERHTLDLPDSLHAIAADIQSKLFKSHTLIGHIVIEDDNKVVLMEYSRSEYIRLACITEVIEAGRAA